MQIQCHFRPSTPIHFTGDNSSPAPSPYPETVKPSRSSELESDTFKRRDSLQTTGDKTLQEFEDRKRFYTDILLHKIPAFRENCEKMQLNIQEEAEKAAAKRAQKETKWPAFPDWYFNSGE